MPIPPTPQFYTSSELRIPETYREAMSTMAGQAGPRAAALVICLGLLARVQLGEWSSWDACLILLVVGGWGIIEWGLHYYVLHAEPLPIIGIRLESVASRMHAGHHRDPWESRTLFFEWYTILGGAVVLFISMFVIAPVGAAVTFAITFILMFERYEWFHLLAHSRVEIESALNRRLIENHTRHHGPGGANRWMGVSRLSGDRLMGTNE